MKILVIDNHIDQTFWGAETVCQTLRPVHNLMVRRAPQQDLPSLGSFDSIILTGSKTSGLSQEPWVMHLMQWIKNGLQQQKAFLGICFGHQILARVLMQTPCIRTLPQRQEGWIKIQTQPSLLFTGLPTEFNMYASHEEEVYEVGPDLRILASSSYCPIQAFQWKNHAVYGVQFHPEKSEHLGQQILHHFLQHHAS